MISKLLETVTNMGNPEAMAGVDTHTPTPTAGSVVRY